MSIEVLKKQIKSNGVGKLYLFFGPEDYLKCHYINLIEKQIIKDDFNSMNKTVFDGKIDLDNLIDACETNPMFSQRRMVLVKNSGLFKTKKDTNKQKAETTENKNVKKIEDYLKNIPDFTCLIFIEENVDKRLKIFNSFKNDGLVVEFEYQSPQILTDWIINIVHSKNKTIEQKSASKIVEYSEYGMRGIYNEIDKLLLYCDDKQDITSNDVDTICTKTIKDTIFDLTDAITIRNPESAFKLLNDLIFLKEPTTKILFMISRQFRNILKVKLYQNSGVTAIGELCSKAGLKPFELGKVKKQSNLMSVKSLKSAIEECLTTDVSIKTGKIDGRIALEVMILKLVM
ncbi:MAG: DNA polymerase III subunit delta [Clostridia bacterium]|jgi:DNA polymerase-3 subunit delta